MAEYIRHLVLYIVGEERGEKNNKTIKILDWMFSGFSKVCYAFCSYLTSYEEREREKNKLICHVVFP